MTPARPGMPVDSKPAQTEGDMALKEQAKQLRGVLEDIERRIHELQEESGNVSNTHSKEK